MKQNEKKKNPGFFHTSLQDKKIDSFVDKIEMRKKKIENVMVEGSRMGNEEE